MASTSPTLHFTRPIGIRPDYATLPVPRPVFRPAGTAKATHGWVNVPQTPVSAAPIPKR